MMTNYRVTIGAFMAAALLGACAAKPPNVEPISTQADATAEVEATQQMLENAKAESLDVLSPKNFARAQNSLDEARDHLVKGKRKARVLENVAESRAWLQQARNRGGIASAAATNLADARSGAIRAQAKNLFPGEFEDVEDKTLDVMEEAEKGDLKELTENGERLTQRYRELEVNSVTKNLLGEAQLNLERAKRERASRSSPKSLASTEDKINAAVASIQNNPRNASVNQRLAKEATDQSKLLLYVNEQTQAGNTEDLVLRTVRQQRTISGLEEEQATAESQLKDKSSALQAADVQVKKQQAALKAAEELRSQLKPNEAEVFVEDNAVKVRLKGVQFSSGQAKITDKGEDLLSKVNDVLGTVGVSSISVEGYTDNVGPEDMNMVISQQRAQAVQNYLVNKGVVSSNQIQAIGKGEDEPVSDNSTARGRAQNRRIDLVIEPAIE